MIDEYVFDAGADTSAFVSMTYNTDAITDFSDVYCTSDLVRYTSDT
jgi:hypothetical protein